MEEGYVLRKAETEDMGPHVIERNQMKRGIKQKKIGGIKLAKEKERKCNENIVLKSNKNVHESEKNVQITTAVDEVVNIYFDYNIGVMQAIDKAKELISNAE